MNVEWALEKFLQFSPLLVAGALPLYLNWRNRKDKQKTEEQGSKSELTSDILADGSSIRKEQSERIKEEQVRYDKIVMIVEQLRDEVVDLKSNIIDLRAEVKELKFVNMTLAQEKQQLEDKNDKLMARIGDLEK